MASQEWWDSYLEANMNVMKEVNQSVGTSVGRHSARVAIHMVNCTLTAIGFELGRIADALEAKKEAAKPADEPVPPAPV